MQQIHQATTKLLGRDFYRGVGAHFASFRAESGPWSDKRRGILTGFALPMMTALWRHSAPRLLIFGTGQLALLLDPRISKLPCLLHITLFTLFDTQLCLCALVMAMSMTS